MKTRAPEKLKIDWKAHGEGRRRGRNVALRAEFSVNRDWGADREKWVASFRTFRSDDFVTKPSALDGTYASADAAKAACETLAVKLLAEQRAAEKITNERQKKSRQKEEARVAKLEQTYVNVACANPTCNCGIGWVPKTEPQRKVYCSTACALRCEVPE